MHTHSIESCENCDEEYVMPSVEALIAGTLALLTGYAQAAPGCEHRPLMAKKLVSNQIFLSGHPDLSPPMRTMLGNMRTRWELEVQRSDGASPPIQPTPLWHNAPKGVQ
jgi:hypothetical protein